MVFVWDGSGFPPSLGHIQFLIVHAWAEHGSMRREGSMRAMIVKFVRKHLGSNLFSLIFAGGSPGRGGVACSSGRSKDDTPAQSTRKETSVHHLIVLIACTVNCGITFSANQFTSPVGSVPRGGAVVLIVRCAVPRCRSFIHTCYILFVLFACLINFWRNG